MQFMKPRRISTIDTAWPEHRASGTGTITFQVFGRDVRLQLYGLIQHCLSGLIPGRVGPVPRAVFIVSAPKCRDNDA